MRKSGIHVPERFSGYNDFKKKKKQKQPCTSAEYLHSHIQELSGTMMQPLFAVKRFSVRHQISTTYQNSNVTSYLFIARSAEAATKSIG